MIKTKNCPICNKNLKLSKTKKIKFNLNSFYEKYLQLYYKKKLNKIRTLECKKCFSYVNNFWFSNDELFRIYNVIYPQHHRGWRNFYKFKKGKYLNLHHEKVFEIFKLLKPKKYAEFNCPFSGVYLNILSSEYKKDQIKKLIKNSIDILKVNQLANKNTKHFKSAFQKFKKLNLKIIQMRKKKKSLLDKTLIIDSSFSCWGYGDISEGVNSRSLSNLIFDLKTLEFNEIKKEKKKFDIFFFADTLDHTTRPKLILDYAIKHSKLVLILSNSGQEVTKQHKFSLSKKFVNYLNNKYYSISMLEDINKNELLFAVSQDKKQIDKLKQI